MYKKQRQIHSYFDRTIDLLTGIIAALLPGNTDFGFIFLLELSVLSVNSIHIPDQ